MKSIFLLSVCVASLSVNFARQPRDTSAKSNQDVLSGLAKIRKETKKIEACLAEPSLQVDDSDVDSSDTESDSSSRTNQQTEISTSVEQIIIATNQIERSVDKGNEEATYETDTHKTVLLTVDKRRSPKKITHMNVVPGTDIKIPKEHHLVASRDPNHPRPSQESESAPQINSTDIDRLVHSVYSKAIEEIKAFSSIELSDDDDSLPQLGRLSLMIQIILDPAQVINDELAAQSLQVGQSAASRKLLATAIEKNKASIDEYSELKKIKKVKNYFKHLERLKSVLMAKAKGILAEFLQSKNTDEGYELISSGATLINSFSLQLAKNGVFRQYFIDKEGMPTLFDSAVPIEADSSQDNAVTHIIDLGAGLDNIKNVMR
jgi:hypothetical protein